MPDDTRHSTPRSSSRIRRPGLRVAEARAARRQGKASWQGRVGVDLRAGSQASELLTPARWTSREVPEPRNISANPQPDAGAQAPSRRKRRPALLALVAAQVAFAIVVVWALTSPTWQVRGVQVVGSDDDSLVRTIESLPLTGCDIFRCDTSAQTRMIERIPLVASASLRALYPDRLLVAVTPRSPSVLWHVGTQAFVVATDGTVLGTLDSDPHFASARLYDVQDESAVAFGGRTPNAGQQIGAPLADMAGQLRTGLGTVLSADWTLQYTSEEGFVAVEADGTRIVFGTPAEAAQAGASTATRGVTAQIEELRSVMALLARAGERASYIDLRWGAHPYYRLASSQAG